MMNVETFLLISIRNQLVKLSSTGEIRKIFYLFVLTKGIRFAKIDDLPFIHSKIKSLITRLKIQENRRIPFSEEEYLWLLENSMIVEVLKIIGVEEILIWRALQCIFDDKRVGIYARVVQK